MCKNCAGGRACSWHRIGKTNVAKYPTTNGGVIGRRKGSQKQYQEKISK